MFRSVYSVSLCCSSIVLCKCVLLPGVNPIAVKYIISYHIISYQFKEIKMGRILAGVSVKRNAYKIVVREH
jgi:hypothetical protein